MSDILGGARAPAAAPAEAVGGNASAPGVLHWLGDRHYLLLKEGVHTLLDRILLKDASASSRATSGLVLYSR